jgi:putative endonuclease
VSGHVELGRRGEAMAASYLGRLGYKILQRNVQTRFGEIDLICLDGDRVVFVEVKSRKSQAFGAPELAVGFEKQQKLSRAASVVLMERHWEDRRARFDVLAITWEGQTTRIDHIKDAFDFIPVGRSRR